MYGLPLLLIAGGLFGVRIYIPAIIFLALALFVLNFFRDPERAIPSEANAIVSPADGRVVEIADEEFAGAPVRRLSIFMSPWNVHVNRSPVDGVLKRVSYIPGSFRAAYRAEASVENEQNIFTIEGEHGTVHVKQIAGALARRIVFWKRPGDQLRRGDRVGLIKFGSRVDLLVGPGAEWRVKIGDHVRAGSSILGSTRPTVEV